MSSREKKWEPHYEQKDEILRCLLGVGIKLLIVSGVNALLLPSIFHPQLIKANALEMSA